MSQLSDQARIEAFLDAMWMEHGLAQNTLSAYRADLQKFSHWLNHCGRGLVECRREDVLANAPAAEHGFFGVPKVIE